MKRKLSFPCYTPLARKRMFAQRPVVTTPLLDVPNIRLQDLNDLRDWILSKKDMLKHRFKLLRASNRYIVLMRWAKNKNGQGVTLAAGDYTTDLTLCAYLVLLLESDFDGLPLKDWLLSATHSLNCETGETQLVSNLTGFANPDSIKNWIVNQLPKLKSILFRSDSAITKSLDGGANSELTTIVSGLESLIRLNEFDVDQLDIEGSTSVHRLASSDVHVHRSALLLSCILGQIQSLRRILRTESAYAEPEVSVEECKTYNFVSAICPSFVASNFEEHKLSFLTYVRYSLLGDFLKKEVDFVVTNTEAALKVDESLLPVLTEEGVDRITEDTMFDALTALVEVQHEMTLIEKEFERVSVLVELGLKAIAYDAWRQSTKEKAALLLSGEQERLIKSLACFMPKSITGGFNPEVDGRSFQFYLEHTLIFQKWWNRYLTEFKEFDRPWIGGFDLYVQTDNTKELIYRIMAERPVFRLGRIVGFTQSENRQGVMTYSGALAQMDFVRSMSPRACKVVDEGVGSPLQKPGRGTKEGKWCLYDIDEEFLTLVRQIAASTTTFMQVEFDPKDETIESTITTGCYTVIPPSSGKPRRSFGRGENRREVGGEEFGVNAINPLDCDVVDLLFCTRFADIADATDEFLAQFYDSRLRALTKSNELGIKDVVWESLSMSKVKRSYSIFGALAMAGSAAFGSFILDTLRLYLPADPEQILKPESQLVRAVDLPASIDLEFSVPASFIKPEVRRHWQATKEAYNFGIARDGKPIFSVLRPEWLSSQDETGVLDLSIETKEV